MKIYKIAFRNPMDMASNKLTKKIFLFVKKLYEENKLFTTNIKATTNIKYMGFEDEIKIAINIDIIKRYISKPFIINANYSYSVPNAFEIIKNPLTTKSFNRIITINIKLATNFSDKFLNEFYLDLTNAVRHELQHLVQDQEKMLLQYPKTEYDIDKLKNSNNIERFQEVAKYIADRSEQEPFIRGFMLQCKKEHKPILDVIKNFIHTTLFSPDEYIEKQIKDTYGLQAEHIESILVNLYTQRVKQIFPNVENIS